MKIRYTIPNLKANGVISREFEKLDEKELKTIAQDFELIQDFLKRPRREETRKFCTYPVMRLNEEKLQYEYILDKDGKQKFYPSGVPIRKLIESSQVYDIDTGQRAGGYFDTVPKDGIEKEVGYLLVQNDNGNWEQFSKDLFKTFTITIGENRKLTIPEIIENKLDYMRNELREVETQLNEIPKKAEKIPVLTNSRHEFFQNPHEKKLVKEKFVELNKFTKNLEDNSNSHTWFTEILNYLKELFNNIGISENIERRNSI